MSQRMLNQMNQIGQRVYQYMKPPSMISTIRSPSEMKLSATEAEVGLNPGPQIRAGMSWPIRSHLVSHVTSCPPMRAHLDREQQPAGHLAVVVGRGEGLGQLQVKHVLGTVSRV